MTARSALAVGCAVAFSAAFSVVPAHADTTAAASPPAPSSNEGWVRFGHFAQNEGAVSVTVDGSVLDPNAVFETVTPYEAVTAGQHVVTVTPLAGPASAAVSADVTVTPGGAATVAALPDGPTLKLTWFQDDLTAAPSGDGKVRVIDTMPADASLSADLSPVTTSAAGSPPAPQIVINQAPYGAASPYVNVPAGSYQVSVESPTGSQVVSGNNWPVTADTVASLVVLQAANQAPTLEVLSDAAGAASAPTGGMQTGFGGAADLLAARAQHKSSDRGKAVKATGSPHPAAVAAPPSTAPITSPVTLNLANANSVQPATPPTGLSIPSIGVDTSVISLGQNPDGTATVPSTTTEASWYDAGPLPGQTGPAVILGHVDSTAGPGVFFKLSELQPGASIVVSEPSGPVDFAVQQVVSYAKDTFPTATVFGPVPDRALRLITCGGPFDSAIGHYDDNVVVYATEVAGG